MLDLPVDVFQADLLGFRAHRIVLRAHPTVAHQIRNAHWPHPLIFRTKTTTARIAPAICTRRNCKCISRGIAIAVILWSYWISSVVGKELMQPFLPQGAFPDSVPARCRHSRPEAWAVVPAPR